MRLTYKYRLKPTKEQITTFGRWLDLARRQYNFRLGQRFIWYEQTRSRVDACPLTCSIVPVEEINSSFPTEKVLSKGKRKGKKVSYFGNNGHLNWADIQKDDLPNTKKLFPEYKQLHSQVLQDVIARVEYAFSRFLFPDKNGKTSGRPRFKGKHYYKSFTYAQMSRKDIYRNNRGRNVVKLSKIGEVELVLHRQIPDGFSVKTGTVSTSLFRDEASSLRLLDS